MSAARYGIGEWYGEPLPTMDEGRRRHLARCALGEADAPICPFQAPSAACSKEGGVCSLLSYDGLEPTGTPVVVCPKRFEEGNLVPKWLAEIVGFNDVFVAREVPFMRSPATKREAGRIDLVVAGEGAAPLWYGLEIQAVYFSGDSMTPEFHALRDHVGDSPPAPVGWRRPDWRSSSAKRLMPQLHVKAPTLRTWGTKIAVAVDRPFFDAIGGKSRAFSQDLDDGDVVWLVPHISEKYALTRWHWEVLSLEASSEKLLSAKTMKRADFEKAVRERLHRIA